MYFARHFAGGCGASWLVLLLASVVSRQHVQVDAKILLGILAGCAIYAWAQATSKQHPARRLKALEEENARLRAILSDSSSTTNQEPVAPVRVR